MFPTSALAFRCMWSLVKEFLQFARREKKWWLIPLGLLLALLVLVLVLSGGSGISWALYPDR